MHSQCTDLCRNVAIDFEKLVSTIITVSNLHGAAIPDIVWVTLLRQYEILFGGGGAGRRMASIK